MLGENLRRARRAAGLSQEELAGDRCTLGYVSHIERGRRTAPPELVAYFEQRLNLPAGSLADTPPAHWDDSSTTARAAVTAAFIQARNDALDGALANARAAASSALAQAQECNAPEMEWALTADLVHITSDLGDFDDAYRHAEALIQSPLSQVNSDLLVRAELLASRAARHGGHTDLARRHAHKALAATRADDTAMRIDALTAILALQPDEPREYLTELAETIAPLPPSHAVGVAAWTLGNHAFAEGDVEQGITWHDLAMSVLSPACDVRRWAKFPRSSAVERMRAGTTEGVENLLAVARSRVAVLESPDEIASLTAAEAEYSAGRGEMDTAFTILDDALATEGISERTRANLHYTYALVARPDAPERQREHALEAARLFTEAEALQDAQQAWKLMPSLQRQSGP